ncbi:MAG TPA: hypothetical protein VGC55_09240 [Dokdonella sp.]
MKGRFSVFLATALTAFAAGAGAAVVAPNASGAFGGHVLGHAPGHRGGMAIAPHGSGNILYDQTLGYDGTGAPVVEYSDVTLRTFDSAGADDFVVGAEGWTISGFNFLAFNDFDDSGVQHIANLADVHVYADDGGVPAANAVCTSLGSTDTPSAYDAATTLTAITLNQPCVLAAGTYWVSLAYEYDGGVSQYVPVYWGLSVNSNGASGVWRQPQGTQCADWTALAECFDPPTSDRDYAFQVIGTAGTDGGGSGSLSLALTAAVDNGDPAQCGTSSELAVNQGQTVNLCYTVTNHTGHALSYQTLSDTLGGNVFSLQQQPLDDGASARYNRQIVAGPSSSGTITATWSAQDHQANYTYDDSGASRFVDIAATGTPLGLADDASADVAVPFPFDFYGTATNVLSISNNGGINIGAPLTTLGSGNFGLPDLFNNSSSVILPLWDDFASSSGDVYYQTNGTAPDRQFIVEWADRVHFPVAQNTDGATFEVIINEADGSFSFEYADVDYSCNGSAGDLDCSGGVSATIGLQGSQSFLDPILSIYTQYSYDSVAVADGQSIVWTPVPVASYVAASSLTLDVGAAIVAANPGALNASAAAGTQATATLTIGNSGNHDLQWTLDEAPTAAGARAHFPPTPYRPAPKAGPSHASSARAAPRTAKGFSAAAARPAPFGTAQVPAFGVLPGWLSLYSLDAANASVLTMIGGPDSLDDNFYDGGAFANNDFGKIYLVGPQGTPAYPYTSGFVSVDTTTGALTMINADPTTQTGGFDIGVLQWDASTATMYASADENQAVNPPPGYQPSSHIYTVDVATGTFTHAFDLPDTLIVALAFDAAGHMYGIDIIADELLAIDKTTGAAQAIGPLGFDANNAQAMDFDPRTGILWYAGCISGGFSCSGQMYTLDTATGLATPVQNGSINGDGEEMTAFSIAEPKGPCANPADVPWLSVSPASGTTAANASTPVTVTFDASGLSDGTYSATLCVQSNDLSRVVVPVPVQFSVGGSDSDRIFADGFDG